VAPEWEWRTDRIVGQPSPPIGGVALMTFGECPMARSPKTTTTDTTKVETQAVNPPVTLTPPALQAVIAEATRQSALKAEMQAALVAKPSTIINGKSERSIKNEIAVVKAFAKAGFKDAKPHVNIFTFRKWMERGYRPVEGSKSLKISNLRLFHVSQVRKITSEEKAAMQAQSDAAVARNMGKVIPIGTQASPQ
jgi:hypothetical protein